MAGSGFAGGPEISQGSGAPVTAARRAPSPFVVGLVGAVVGALVAGIPLLLTRGGGDGGGLGGSHASLSAPDTLPGYSPLVKNPKADPATIKRVTGSEAESSKRLSDAYGGASAVVRQYSDSQLLNMVSLEAVRAESPKPFYPYVDAAQLGMAKPDTDVEVFGEVACVVRYQPVPAGQPEPPDQVFVTSCERTSAHLTVRLRFGSGDAWHSPADAAKLADQVWAQLS